MEIFVGLKNFNTCIAHPSYLCIAEAFAEIHFANAVMVAITSMQSLIQDKNFHQ
jgi:hypothetical protein